MHSESVSNGAEGGLKMENGSTTPLPSVQAGPAVLRGEGEKMAARSRGLTPARQPLPEKRPLTARSLGRGNWDCVRQMQMYRSRPDVLAAALRDMGFSEGGDECEPHEQSADDETTDSDATQRESEHSLN